MWPEDRLTAFWKLTFCASANRDGLCFPSRQTQPWLTSLEDYERKWAIQCSARPLSFASGCAFAMWVNSSPPLTSLGSTCPHPNKRPVYLYAKQTSLRSWCCFFWSTEELCHSFARSGCIFQESHSEISVGAVCSCFFSEKSVASFFFPKVLSKQSACKQYWCFRTIQGKKRQCFLFCRACLVLSISLF